MFALWRPQNPLRIKRGSDYRATRSLGPSLKEDSQMLMACTSFDNLFRGQDGVMYQNSYQLQGEGNLVTGGIYSLLIPTREGEIQQVSCNA